MLKKDILSATLMVLKNMVISENRCIDFNFLQLMNVGNMTSVFSKDNLASHYQCTVSQCVWRSHVVLVIKFLFEIN